MTVILIILTVVFGLLTLASLVAGILGMSTGGSFNARYGNVLMRYRLLFQALTLVALFALFSTM